MIHPAYYRHILPYAPEKFTRFAQEVFGRRTAQEGLQALTEFLGKSLAPYMCRACSYI